MSTRNAKFIMWSVCGVCIAALMYSAIWSNSIIGPIGVLVTIPIIVFLPKWLGLPPPDRSIFEQSPDGALWVGRARRIGSWLLYGSGAWALVAMLAMYLLRWNNNLILALILSIAGLGLLLSLGFSIYGVVLEYNETKRRIREKKRRPGAGN